MKVLFVLNGGGLVACLTFSANEAVKLTKKPSLSILEMLQFYVLGIATQVLKGRWETRPRWPLQQVTIVSYS
jgi:hypothetical protein